MVQMSGQNLRNKPERASTELNLDAKSSGADCSLEDKQWICNICVQNEIYNNFENFTSHMETHLEGYPSRCRVCFAQFATKSELGEHIKDKHTVLTNTIPRLRSEANNNLESEWNAANNNSDSNTFEKHTNDLGKATRKCTVQFKKYTRHRRNDISTSAKADNSELFADIFAPIRSYSKCYGTVSKRKKHIPLINYCYLCKIDFECYDAWRKHAVFDHIISRKPFPIVEMNYVDVTASQAGVPTAITTTNKEGVTKELKLTFSKAKGSYVVKKCSISDDSDCPENVLSSASTSTEVLSSSEGIKDDTPKDVNRRRKHRNRKHSSSSSNTIVLNSEKISLLEQTLQSGNCATSTGIEKRRSSSTDICDNESDSLFASLDKENSFPCHTNPNPQIDLYHSAQDTVSKYPTEDSGLVETAFDSKPTSDLDRETESPRSSNIETLDEKPSSSDNSHINQMVVPLNELQHTSDCITDDTETFTAKAASPSITCETISEEGDYNFNEKESPADDSYILGLATEKEVEAQHLLMGHESIESSISESILQIADEEQAEIMISEDIQSVSGKSIVSSNDVFATDMVHPFSPNNASDVDPGTAKSTNISTVADKENECNGDEEVTPENYQSVRSRSNVSSVHSETLDEVAESNIEDTHLDSGDIDNHCDDPNSSQKESCNVEANENSSVEIEANKSNEDGGPQSQECNAEEIIPGDGIASDEFQCKVCYQNFDCDDDLEDHFEREHFRVSVSSNLLEPESPYPASVFSQNVDQSDVNNDESNSTPDNPLNVSLHNLPTQGQIQGDNNALAQLLRGSGGMSNSIHTSSRGNGMALAPAPYQPPRPMIPPRNLSPISPPTQFGPAIPTPQRPALSTAQVNYLMNQHAHPNHQMSGRPSNMGQSQGRPPLVMNPAIQRMSVSQGHHHNLYPTSLHHALTNQNDSQSRQMPPPTSVRHNLNTGGEGGPRIVEVSSMHRPQLYRTPMNMTQTYQQQQHQHQLQQHQQQQQQQQHQQRYIQQQQIQQQQLQIQQRQQLLHQQQQAAALKQQAHLQQQQVAMRCDDQQQNFRVTNVRGGVQLQQIRHSSPIQGKRPASAELNEQDRAKQARLEISVASGGMQMTPTHFIGPRSRMPVAVNHGTSSEVTITPRVNVGQVINNSDTPPPLDRNVAAAIGSVGTSGLNSVRLGNSITLSVCPGNESVGPNGRCSSGSSSGSTSPVVLSSTNVASALAVRGVTVTPASPPTALGRGSPSSDTSPRGSPSGPFSVIHRVAAPNSISPVRNYSPPNMASLNTSNTSPLGLHQFVVPRNPAPRATLSSPGALVNNSTERPGRPPTVDLTDDDVIQHNLENQGRPPRPMMEPQRHVTRPPYSCSVCHMNFNSIAMLESHRFSAHGIGAQTLSSARPSHVPQTARGGPVSVRDQRINANSLAQITRTQVRPPPPQLQQMRGPLQTQHASPNPKYLYIPLLDLSRMDASKLRRLEDLGISNVVPLHGNEAAAGQMGIPIMSLRTDGQSAHVPWDCVLPVGPLQNASNLLGNNNNSTSGQNMHINRPH